MILPDKHRRIENSTLGHGALLLAELLRPRTVSALWDRLHAKGIEVRFDQVVEALDFLYMLGAIELVDGRLTRTR